LGYYLDMDSNTTTIPTPSRTIRYFVNGPDFPFGQTDVFDHIDEARVRASARGPGSTIITASVETTILSTEVTS